MHFSEHDNGIELVAQLVQGDSHAFETIYRRHMSELYAYAQKNISTAEDCEEIIQDIFTEIWQQRERLTFITDLKGYLYRILRFRIVKYFRHEKVKRKYEEHYRLFEVMHDSMQEESFDAQDIRELLEQCLLQLPARCQEAVKLRIRENLSNEDIARRMNITKAVVENYMVQALRHLRNCFPKIYHA